MADEGGGAVALGLSAPTDVDSPLLASAIVQITQNYVEGQDVLAFVDQANVSGSFDSLTGTMTLTGPASPAEFEAALRLVTFQTVNDNTISESPREISYTVNDGIDDSTVATSTINVSATSEIIGSVNPETLTGDGFDDAIYGLADDDTLIGGAGHDLLYGGPGADSLTGGADADTFVFQASDGTAIDTVQDYNEAEGDLLDISELLSGAFNPATPEAEITFGSAGGSDTRMYVDGVAVADLIGVGDTDTLTVVYDDMNHTAQVTVAYTVT